MIHLSDAHNVADHLTAMAARQPDVTAMYMPGRRRGRGRVYTEISYRELNDRSDRIALGLSHAGIQRGERVALMVKPSPELFALTFGLFKAGVVPVMVDPGIGLKPLKACLGRAAPTGFIGIPAAHVARRVLGLANESVTSTIVVSSSKFGLGNTTLDEVEHRGAEELARGGRPQGTNRDDVAAILFTSGSTGVPKGVVYRHRQFLAQVDALQSLFDFAPGEVDLPTFPLFALFDPALGMTTVIPHMDATQPALVDPREIIEPVQRFRVTTMFGSPALLNAVGRYGIAHKTQLSSLRRVIAAGAPLPAETMRRWHRMMSDDANVYPPYGATECLPMACLGSRQILSSTWAKTQEGAGVCVGRPVDAIDLRVIAIDDDAIESWSAATELPRGQVGEIVVRGPMVTEEYFADEENTRKHKIYDGESLFHRVGDLGYLDDEGRVWFCGRKSHRVILHDRVLFTVPHEKRFDAHPLVYRTALVGVGQGTARRPVLCVELEDAARPVDVLDALRDIAKQHPETADLDTFLVHPGFPVDIRHNAKIGRGKLAVWATSQTSS